MPWQAWRRKGTRSSYNKGALLWGSRWRLPAGAFSLAAAIAASSLTLPACGPAREVIEHPQHERLQKFLQRYPEV